MKIKSSVGYRYDGRIMSRYREYRLPRVSKTWQNDQVGESHAMPGIADPQPTAGGLAGDVAFK